MSTPEQRRRNRRKSRAYQLRQRRKRARELRDQGLSIRRIADEMGIAKSTVAEYLRDEPRARSAEPRAHPNSVRALDEARPVAGALPGNERAVTHGAFSERRLAPVREQHARQLAERYGWIDPARRALQAQRLAQIDLAGAWLDRQGTVVRDEEGRTFDIADKVARWLGQAEAWFERAEAERREHRRFDALAEVMSDDEEAGDDGDAA